MAAVDGKAQARTVGGDKFAVEIAGPFSKGATPAVVKDNCDGTYDVIWHTDAAGNYLINAKLDGFAVGGCPVRCTVNAAAMEGSKCTATGDGLSKARAGVPASFNIKAADRFGNRRSTGSLDLVSVW